MLFEDQKRAVALAEEMKGSKLTREENFILCRACQYVEKKGGVLLSRQAIAVLLSIVAHFTQGPDEEDEVATIPSSHE